MATGGCGVGRGSRLKVFILLKSGSSGRTIYPGLENLHYKTGQFDVDMTWKDNVLKIFGIDLDPEKYCFRRGSSSVARPKHEVTDPVRVLLAECKVNHKVFIVNILSKVSLRRRNARNKVNNKNVELASLTTTILDQHEANVTLTPGIEHNEPVKRTKRRGRPKRKRGSVGPRRKTPMVPSSRTDVAEPEQSQLGSSSQSKVVDISSVCEKDDDAQSQISQTSQEECEEVGVAYDENFKAQFLNRVQISSNAQLLRARWALRELRDSEFKGKRNRWTRWSLTCPYLVTLIRTFFDV